MSDVLRADEREEHIVILGTLIFVNRLYNLGEAVEGIVATSRLEDVAQQGLLAVVGSEDGDAVRRIPQKAHVHISCNDILSLSQVLKVVRCRTVFASAPEVTDVNKLIIKNKARVRGSVRPGSNDIQVAKIAVLPAK